MGRDDLRRPAPGEAPLDQVARHARDQHGIDEAGGPNLRKHAESVPFYAPVRAFPSSRLPAALYVAQEHVDDPDPAGRQVTDYCRLDTLAMLRIVERLQALIR